VHEERDSYQAWLLGEVMLVCLLGSALAFFLFHPSLSMSYRLPELGTVLSTVMMLAGLLVTILAGARFSVEGRRLDLLLAGGFFTGAATTRPSSTARRSGRPRPGRTTPAGRCPGC
jgi:hypothetical protein